MLAILSQLPLMSRHPCAGFLGSQNDIFNELDYGLRVFKDLYVIVLSGRTNILSPLSYSYSYSGGYITRTCAVFIA